QRVLQRVLVMAQLREHHLPVLALLHRAEQGPGRRTDIRQPRAVLRRRDGGGQDQAQGESGREEAQGQGLRQRPPGAARCIGAAARRTEWWWARCGVIGGSSSTCSSTCVIERPAAGFGSGAAGPGGALPRQDDALPAARREPRRNPGAAAHAERTGARRSWKSAPRPRILTRNPTARFQVLS